MIIRSGNNEKEFPDGRTVQECLKALDAFPRGTLAAQSGGVVCELNDTLRRDCTLTPLTLEHEEGRRVYERSLRFVMLLALRHLYPYQRVRIEYSVGYGVYVRLPGIELHRQDIVRIENEMRRLTELDLVFEKKQWTKEDAIRYFEEEKQDDKVELLRRRSVPYFNMYSIDGMWEYFYGAMTVSTGYVRVFTLFELRGGFVLQLPAGADFDHAAPYYYRPKHLEIFAQSAAWCEILGVTNVTDVSRLIEEHKLRNFIRVNEALHEAAIDEIAKKIHEQNKHIVLVAGPSSSGKTTFSGRLSVHLQMYGHPSRRISMDDFFVNRDDMPLQLDGTKDYDSIDALDIKLLADSLTGLLNGEEVFMPNFDFASGAKDYLTPPTSLLPGEIIILEGIHGLNPQVSETLPADEIYRVFASALTCLNLDDHNRIRTTDVRLLRRIVRDNQFRGYAPEVTLDIWPRVRKAEEKYIFTYQENADSMFNTALHYELPILKLFAYDLLKEVPSSSPNYLLARRLIKTLNYLPDIDREVLEEIPPLSLLREFIGGCTMEEV
uniref:Phosphoribulokinase/uridine kinase n=1 Tax=uncultured bacterium Contig87 TaxID=1393621 RepID=W0FNY0_9BACT|nr:phosphoribulokinase/uridine kinase [uncultured bacterium Contig87]